MPISKILSSMKKLTEDFGLKFKREAFSYLVVTKEEIVLMNFIARCPKPEYNKFGKETEERLENIIQFANSKEFLREIREPQGCVIGRFVAKQELKLAERIPDSNLRKII